MDGARAKARRRSSGDSEAGFSMAEALVTVMILGVLTTPLAGVFNSGFTAAADASQRTDAVALATSDLALVRSLPYSKVGFYADQNGYEPSVGSMTTVTLGSTTPAGYVPQIVPVSTSKVGTITFEVSTEIVWAAASGALPGSPTSYSQAYKEAMATVSWGSASTPQSVTEQTIIYSGALGAYSGPGSDATGSGSGGGMLGAPQLAAAQVPASPAGESEVGLTWSMPPGTSAGYFVVEWSTDPAMPSSSLQASPHESSSVTSYTVQGLSAGSTYFFEVVAYQAGDSATMASNQVEATTDSSSSSTCSLGSFTVMGQTSGNTGKTYLNPDGTMSEDLTLALDTTGSCPGPYSVMAEPSGTTTADPGAPYVLPTASSGQWIGTVPSAGETGWALGEHSFVVMFDGSPVSPPVGQTFLVCAYLPPSEQSSSQNQC